MHRIWPNWLLVTAFVAGIGASIEPAGAATRRVSAPQAQIVLGQTVLGPMPADFRQLAIATDAGRVAVVASAGSRQIVIIDGNEGPPYSSIVQTSGMGQGKVAPPQVMISPDGSRVAYVATKGPSECVMVLNQKEGPAFDSIKFATFSPVGHRLAYIGSKGGKQYVIVDATLSPAYQMVMPGELSFSEDGKHVGYTASTGSAPSPWRVVVDGKEGTPYANVFQLQFSKDGAHHAYVAVPGNNVEENHVVVDDKAGPKVGTVQSVALSSDGKHVAYVARPAAKASRKWCAFIDGQAGPEFDTVTSIVISPDGNHTAYCGSDNATGRPVAYAIVDGKKSLDYADCQSFRYSPDSQHLAYVARASSGKSVLVLDGKESEAHDSIDVSSILFSPDGKRLAYLVSDQGRQHEVVDGKVGPGYPVIDLRSRQFSPDSRHYSYKTRGLTSTWTYAVDDAPAGDGVGPEVLVTSADGKHWAAVVVKDPETPRQSAHVLLDGKPVGEACARIEHLQLSDDGAHVAYAATFPPESGKKLTHAVHDGHEGPGYFRIDEIVISPDGQHIAYIAAEDNTKYQVVVDALEGPVCEQVLAGGSYAFEGLRFQEDGSLAALVVMDKKLSRLVVSADAIRSLPKPVEASAAGAPGFAQIHAFGQVEQDGAKPAVLAAAPDGTLYGATSAGGEFQKGVLFRLGADGSGYKILHPFEGGQGDGAYPSTLFVGPDGALYGTLQVEGPSSYGAVFRAATDGSDYKLLHAFTGNKDGAAPVIGAIDADGAIFGISSRDRMPTRIFRMRADGSDFKSLHEHNDPNTPAGAIGPIVDGGDGFFYGPGGTAIFKIAKDGSGYAVVRPFKGPPRDIWNADRQLLLGSDKNLYGIASSGGQSTGGVLFKLGRDGNGYALIADPKQEILGPRALVEGPDGKLYALLEKGIGRLEKDGSGLTVLQEMDGRFFAPVLVVQNGALFGMTTSGGKGGGVIFRYGLAAPGAVAAAPSVTLQAVKLAPLDSNVEVPPAAGG